MDIHFSIIIPVYNRPQELDELLQSIANQNYANTFQVVVVEDGSTISSEKIIYKYKDVLSIVYIVKKNSGPGHSRNVGMEKASGNFFIILDSDVLLPKNYLSSVENEISEFELDAFGGVDDAHESFTPIQKAINYAMTSFLTTGGLRNKDSVKNDFQLRSFNMGISKKVFNKTKGFSKQRYGEDIDLSFRIKDLGFNSKLIPNAKVYHKRRIDFNRFFKQIFNFGRARPILNKLHPKSAKITYWFPTLFSFGFLFSLWLLFFGYWQFLALYFVYFLMVFVDSFYKNKNFQVAWLSVQATIIQFIAYGVGFLRSWVRLNLQHKSIRETFPEMFR